MKLAQCSSSYRVYSIYVNFNRTECSHINILAKAFAILEKKIVRSYLLLTITDLKKRNIWDQIL